MLTLEQLVRKYPEAIPGQIKFAIKYQDKFNLTLENLKCLNPDCSNMRLWNNNTTGFAYCCSKACRLICKSQIFLETKLKKRKNYFEKTGYENPNQNPEVIQKKIYSYMEKTGYLFPGQNPEVKQKAKQTYFKKTGYENAACNPEVKLKREKTYFEKTGYHNPMINPEVKQKAKQTYFKKTGYENAACNPEVKLKREKTCLTRYDSISFCNCHLINVEQWFDKQFWLENFIIKSKFFNLYKCMEYFNCKQPAAHNQIKKLGIEYTKLGGTSLKEQALYPLLSDLDIKYITNTKAIIKPMELDIWLSDLKLAIEYNGSYWHSYHETVYTSPKQLDYDYMKYSHQQKSLACMEAGIRLLHIYEQESEDLLLNKLENFLVYDPALDTNTEWDLDTGCYPLGIDYQVIEPESSILLKDRVIWNAGKIKI